MKILFSDLNHAIVVTTFVFVMMMIIDYINVLTKGKMSAAIRGGIFRQYVISSFLGATPGCLGAFMNVSFYVRGLISFGAIAGGMIATSGDESFIMLALFPGKALFLFAILFVVGIISAFFIDKVLPLLKIKTCEKCELSELHEEDFEKAEEKEGKLKRNILFHRSILIFVIILLFILSLRGIAGPEGMREKIIFWSVLFISIYIISTVKNHFLEEHIWNHLCKRHLWRVFLWTFGALIVIDIGLKSWNLESFIKSHMAIILIIACLVGIIPESGPHLIFVMMFSKGLIPFSILLASSIVQDGHGMLPLLSYSLKDSILVKMFNLLIGLIIGFIVYIAGF